MRPSRSQIATWPGSTRLPATRWEKGIRADEREEWNQADSEEWAKIVGSGAVTVLSPRGIPQVPPSAQARGQGGPRARITHSKTSPPVVVNGFEDPDILELDRPQASLYAVGPTHTSARCDASHQEDFEA